MLNFERWAAPRNELLHKYDIMTAPYYPPPRPRRWVSETAVLDSFFFLRSNEPTFIFNAHSKISVLLVPNDEYPRITLIARNFPPHGNFPNILLRSVDCFGEFSHNKE
jgi:hypothetical protein